MPDPHIETTFTPAKVCIYCRTDCSDRPRVRDRQGRYACRACAESAAKTFERQGPLAEDIDVDILLAPEPELKKERVRVECAVCLREILPGESKCVSCNYDPAVGLTEETLVARRPLGKEGLVCVNCGYSLRGLRAMRCPECRQPVVHRAEKGLKAGAFRDEATRQAYVVPLMMLGVGGGLYVIWSAIAHGPAGGPLAAINLTAQVVTGLLAFFLCSVLIFGFDAPWHLTALRLAGIYSVVNVAGLAIDELLGGACFLHILLILVYIQLLMSLLELDLQDAIILGFVLFLVRFGLVMGLVMWGIA